jgi:hypothetical protein
LIIYQSPRFLDADLDDKNVTDNNEVDGDGSMVRYLGAKDRRMVMPKTLMPRPLVQPPRDLTFGAHSSSILNDIQKTVSSPHLLNIRQILRCQDVIRQIAICKPFQLFHKGAEIGH